MTIGWPSGTIDQAPVPTNLLPGRIEGWPAGTQRAANDAERILSTAVAWWDPTVSGFRDGDRWLRNSGTAGGLLDLRLGSSVVANTNDPTFLSPESAGYVYLPGVAGNYLSVPDEAALDITGDIDIRAQVAATNWTDSNTRYLIAKATLTANTPASYALSVVNGSLRFFWWPNGTTASNAVSTSTVSATNNQPLWVRATLDVDNEAATPQYEVKFYTSSNGLSWTQLGNTVTGTTGVTSIFAGDAPLLIGRTGTDNTVNYFDGRVYRAQVLNGIDGTTVLDVDCDALTSGSATSFTATTGQTVTINRSTSGRKSVAQPARGKGGRACFLLGTDDYFEVPAERVWQHQLLNFGQGDSFTVLVVTRQHNYTASQQMLSKEDNATAGYRLMNQSTTTTTLDARVYSNSTLAQAVAAGRTNSRLHVQYVVIGLGARAGFDATASTITASLSMNGTYNTTPLRIGRSGQGAVYCDMEFTAAAVFRRALTAAEITSITRYYGAS